jgi:hypothetical protein
VVALLFALLSTACQRGVEIGVHNACSFSIEATDDVTDTGLPWLRIAAGERSAVYGAGTRDSYQIAIRRGEQLVIKVIQRSEFATADPRTGYDLEYALTVTDCDVLEP